MNWKGFGRNWPWPDGLFLKELRKTSKNLGQNSQHPGQDLNKALPKYNCNALLLYKLAQMLYFSGSRAHRLNTSNT
jgi:hypothetical protein